MNDISPSNQTKLLGLDRYISELISLSKKDKLPNKILLSGNKGIGKSTLAYHFVNYSLTIDEEFNYDEINFKINENNRSFKTIQNQSNTNFILIDINPDKKLIDINQIRNLILNLNKLCFNKTMGSNLDNREDTLETMEKEINPKVDLNNLMKRVKDDEKKSKRQNIVISAAALSAVAVFGIILTL